MRFWFFVLLALSAAQLRADAEIILSITNLVFGQTFGFPDAFDDNVSATGIDTPLNSGVTVNGGGAGLDGNIEMTSSDANYWYLGPGSFIMEAGFDFIGGPLQLGDIGMDSYEPGSWLTPTCSMAKTGAALSFTFTMTVPIDPRLAAFYGLAPPCLAAPSSSLGAAECSSPLGVDRLGIFTATGSPLDAEGDSVFTGEIVATPIPGPAAVLHLFTVLVAIAIWYEARRRAAKKAGLNRTIRFKLYRLLRRAKRIKGRSTLRTASTCAPLIIGMLNLVPMARADTIQFILNNGVLSVDYTGSRVESLEGCCGGIFEGPGPGINATSGGMGGDLFGDAGDPSLVVFIGTLYNAADPTTPALIEVEVRETDISPDICHDVLGCVQTQDGVNVDFDNIYWSDGTMNTINFLSVVSPEPESGYLLGAVMAAVLFLRWKRRKYQSRILTV